MIYLTNHEPDLVKTCLNVKDPYEAKYQLLINKESKNPLNGSTLSLNTQIMRMISMKI